MSDFMMPYSATLQSIDNWANQIKMKPHNMSLNFGMNMTAPMNFNFSPIMPNFGNYGTTNNSTSTEDAFSKYLRECEEKSKPAIEAAQKESQRQEVQRQAKDTKQAVADSLNNLKAKKKSLAKNKQADGSSLISSARPETEEVEETKADGSKVKVKKVKRKSFLEKSFNFISNGVSSVWNSCKGLVGYEKDGSWNPWKFARNAVIAVGVGALCVAFPPLGTGLLYGGLLYGVGGMAVNGTERYNLGCKLDKAADAIDKAKTDEEREKAEEEYIKIQQEIDKSEQDFGQSTFLAVTSGIGAYKAVQAAKAASQAASSAATGGSKFMNFLKGNTLSAKTRTSWYGRAWEKTANFFLDTFVNPISATGQQTLALKTDILAQTQANIGNGLSGSKLKATLQVGKNNIVKAYQATTSKGIYENHKQQMEQRFNDKLADIDSQITSKESIINDTASTPEEIAQATRERVLLWEEKKLVLECQKDLSSIGTTNTTKANFDNLKVENAHKSGMEKLGQYTPQNGKYTINGVEVSPAEFTQFKARTSGYLSAHQKELTGIIREYNNTMLSQASPWKTIKRKIRNNATDQQIRADLETYAPTSSVSWFKNWTTGLFNTKQANAIGGSVSDGIVWKYTKAGMISSASTTPKLLGMYDPIANMGNMTYVSAKQYKEEEEYLDSLIKTQEKIQSKISSASTNEELELAQNLQEMFQKKMTDSDALVAQGNKRETIKYEDIEKELKTALEEQVRQREAAQQAAAAQAQQQLQQGTTEVPDATRVDNTSAVASQNNK